MGFSLRNLLEEAAAQVNPFDGGQTAQTVRTNRQVEAARTKRIKKEQESPEFQEIIKKANQRNVDRFRSGQIDRDAYQRQSDIIFNNGNPNVNRLSSFSNSNPIKDFFDSNSGLDQLKRTQSGQPRFYRDQQIAQGNTRPFESLGGQLFGNTARFANTAAGALSQIPSTIRGELALRTGNDEALRNALESQRNIRDESFKPDGGIFGVGSIFNDPTEFSDLGAGEIAKRTGLTTLGTASEILPFKVAAAPTAKVTTKLAVNAGVDAAAGAGESVARQYAQTGQIDPRVLAGDVIANAALGTIPTVGGVAADALRNPVTTTKLLDKSGKTNLTNVVAKQDPEFIKLDNRITKAINNAEEATGQLKQNYIDEARDLIRQRNLRNRELAGTGAIGSRVDELAQRRADQLPQSQSTVQPLQALDSSVPRTPSQAKVVQQLQESAQLVPSANNTIKPVEIKVTQKGGAKKVKVNGTNIPNDLIDNVDAWDDVGSTLKTMDRNLEKAAPDEATYRRVYDSVIAPRAQAVTDMVDEIASRKNELKSAVDRFGLKNKKIRADVMKFGEKRMTYDGLVTKYGAEQADKIRQADRWFRKQYDTILDETNSVLRKFNMDEIPRRDNYYTHFQDNGVWSSFGLRMQQVFSRESGNLQDSVATTTRGQRIDPKLLGQSEFTSPKKKFNPFAQTRLGDKTKFDAVEAYERYLFPTLHNKHLTESVVKTRMLTKQMQDATLESQNLPRLIRQLQEYGNSLAGKSNRFDRPIMETKWGKRALDTSSYLQQQMGRNVILGSMRSAIMQVAALPQTIADNGLKNTLTGGLEMLASNFRDGDDVIELSPFLRRRYTNLDSVVPTKLRRAENAAGYVFESIEQATAETTWRASYKRALSEGFDGDKAIQEADRLTERILGGRSVGEKAEAFRSVAGNNFLQFQLEVNNFAQQVSQDFRKDPKKLAKLFAATYVFNLGFEQALGDKPLPDPIDAIIDSATAAGEGDATLAIGRLPGEVVSNVPGGSAIASLIPENGLDITFGNTSIKTPKREDLLGGTNAGRYAGSPIAGLGALENPTYLIPRSFGQKQLERTIQGLQDTSAGVNTNAAGNARFEVPSDPISTAKAALFGTYSLPQARDYFDNNRAPLTENQTAEAFASGDPGSYTTNLQNERQEGRDNPTSGDVVTNGNPYELLEDAFRKSDGGQLKGLNDYEPEQLRQATDQANNNLRSDLDSAGLPVLDSMSFDTRMATDYAKLQNSIADLDDIAAKKKVDTFYKSLYKSQMDDTTQSFYKLGDDDMRAELLKGTITREQMDRVIDIDNILTQAGLQQYMQVGKTLRAELGYGSIGSTSRTSSRRSGSSRRSSGSRRGKFDYNLYYGGAPSPTSINASLGDLIRNATV